MKKVLLSALAVSVMFVSCSDKEDVKPPVKVSQEKDQKESFAAIKEIHSGDVSKIKANFPKLKEHLAVDAFHTQSKNEVVADFQSWLDNYESKKDTKASNGTAGTSDNRVFNENGIEYFQLAKKGLIGAYQFSNALTEIKSGGNNEEIFVNVTAYLLGSSDHLDIAPGNNGDYPEYNGNEFARYLNKVNKTFKINGNKGIGDEFYASLKKAKENINSKSFSSHMLKSLRLAQKIAAVRCVHYLNHYKNLKDNLDAQEAHEISEGLGFLYALQFTYAYDSETNTGEHAPYFSRSEVENFIENLNLWNKDEAAKKLEGMVQEIAKKFDFNWETEQPNK